MRASGIFVCPNKPVEASNVVEEFAFFGHHYLAQFLRDDTVLAALCLVWQWKRSVTFTM